MSGGRCLSDLVVQFALFAHAGAADQDDSYHRDQNAAQGNESRTDVQQRPEFAPEDGRYQGARRRGRKS